MAIISISVNRLHVVSDLFGSFHEAHEACSKLKGRSYPEESIIQFVQLTDHDDLEARTAMLKDLGIRKGEIEFLDKALAEGKVLVCVDALEEKKCSVVEGILTQAGGLQCEMIEPEAEPAARKKPAVRRKKAVAKVDLEIKLRD